MPKVMLTDEIIKKSIQTVTKRQELCCTLLPCFYCEFAPGRKFGTFYIRIKQPNSTKNRNIRIGRSSELSASKARQQAKLIKAEWVMEKHRQREANQGSKGLTLTEYVELHYLPFARVRKRTWRNDKSLLDARILKRFGDRRLSTIGYAELQSFLHELKEVEGLSGSQADHHIKLLRRIYNLAIKAELVSKNPAEQVELYNENLSREQFLTDTQIADLVKVLNAFPNRNVADVIMLLLATGLRLNEVVTLRWDCCDLDNGRLTISAAQSKSKREKHFPINSVAMTVLKGRCRKANPEFVFSNRNTGRAYSTSILRKSWGAIKERAGIDKDFKVHSLRHAHASLLASNNRSMIEIKELLGHADITTSMRYSHIADAQLKQASESVSDRILAASKANGSTSH